ncbi:putative F-box protein At5g55150 isoform X2 [Tasmannia lanceolata]|uniref:putative F-box protein At5g55150 isoform X2 n=1 Tax=Tasmannia lanceolata TaxID=3420 RepID=UPI004063E76B
MLWLRGWLRGSTDRPEMRPHSTSEVFSHFFASNAINTKKIHNSSDLGEQSELLHRSVSQHRPPLLMLPNEERSESRKFFCLSENKLYDIQIPEFHGKWCCGSSKGWLVTVDDNSNVHLLNPLSKIHIQLPSLDKFTHPQHPILRHKKRGSYRWYMRKTVLSADPISTPYYIVVSIVTYHRLFSFYKPGDEGWTTLNRQWGSYEDVIYHKGKFYCIIDSGNLVACDFSSNGLPKLTKISKSDGKRISESDGKRSGRRYLVESSGELLNVCRYYEMHPMYVRYLILGSSKCLDGDFDPRNLGWTMRTSYFEVSKLDQNTGKWIELESLGDQVLFLGLNSSLSLSALDFPQLKRNCIYFTDDSDVNNEGIDNGVYDLENESIKPCYPNSPSWITKLIWLHPNLCGVPNC